ncbi:hypothetical protein WME79_10380 [Sorangium sp. So ce726]|uniref:hypothetical protein n=1 Tax=Sorangium sp. So ce726 TaxID=3133319 RepID=UPI003F6482B7
MGMQRSGAPSPWLEIVLDRAGREVQASARGSRGEQTTARSFGPELGAEHLGSFSDALRKAAARGRPFGARVETAQAIYRAVLCNGIADLRVRFGEAAGGPFLVRLVVRDPELQEDPWEALAAPGEAMRFQGISPELLPVRGVTTTEPWQPCEVRGAVRVLPIAPSGRVGLARLKEGRTRPSTAFPKFVPGSALCHPAASRAGRALKRSELVAGQRRGASYSIGASVQGKSVINSLSKSCHGPRKPVFSHLPVWVAISSVQRWTVSRRSLAWAIGPAPGPDSMITSCPYLRARRWDIPSAAR